MVVSNETISEDIVFSLRNIQEHKYIDKRCTLYSITYDFEYLKYLEYEYQNALSITSNH